MLVSHYVCRIPSSSSLEAADVMKGLNRPHHTATKRTACITSRTRSNTIQEGRNLIKQTQAISIAPKSYQGNIKSEPIYANMSDSGTKRSGTEITGGQPREESQEGPASTSSSPNRSSNSNNKRPIKKRNHSTIDDARSSRSDELEAAESLVTVSTAAVVSASASASAPPAPKRLKGDSSGDNSNEDNEDDEDEEEDHSNDEEDEDSSSEQSEGAATTSSLSGSDDCVEAKVDSTTNGGSSSGGGGGSGGSTKKAKKAKKAGLRKGKWTVRFVYYSLVLVVSVLSFCLAPLCLVQATPVFKNSPHPSLCPQTYYVHVIATDTHNSPRKRPTVPLSSDTSERACSAFRMA